MTRAILLLAILFSLFCQNAYSVEAEKEIISLNKNYLALGDRTTPIKLELSFKHRLLQDGNLYIGFHQKSFWDINNGSSPVLDSNYNPHIYYDLGRFENLNLTLGLLEHLSNGGNGNKSRGTNMSFIHAYEDKQFSSFRLNIGFKLFASYKKDNGSPDINEYMGIWALMVRVSQFLPFTENYHAIELRSNAGGEFGTEFSKGSNEIGLYFQPSKKTLFNIYAQYFFGRNEYLLEYKTYHSSARIGISLDI